ncbi:hypothetical protein ZWY2020_016030 [Hordeum vulgare]|nr:hypothetical protein ZWY2020_016030 [Hordeum vulgare]
MPPGSEDENAPAMSATDRIGALPDHMLHHLLSFLPAQAAVRMCVLARRWRHLWKSTTGLRIVGLDHGEPVQVQDLRKFMDHLLVLRERTYLNTVEIKFDNFLEEDQPYVNLWTRFAVICKVRALTLHTRDDQYLWLARRPASCLSASIVCFWVVSQELKHLKLISETEKFIFSRDLKHCPTFTKLKTLLLNDYWCESPDMDPLSCILKNSPVLEKLTLELFPKALVSSKGEKICVVVGVPCLSH